MNGLIVIQARLSSTRLPGKVLLPLYKGKSLLDIQLEKLSKSDTPLVLATTTNGTDDALEAWARENGVDCFRGSEENVLKRFLDCSLTYGAEHVVRVCSDNPFLQTDDVNHFLSELKDGADYISYSDLNGVPSIRKHWGLFVEGVSRFAMEKALKQLEDHKEAKFYQEHVTNFIYSNDSGFIVKLPRASEVIVNREDLRFTIDTKEDFLNAQRILELTGGDLSLSLEELVELVDKNPDLKEVMKEGINSFDK